MDYISCVTFIKNAIENDFPIDLWIEQHAPLFDEIVVLDTGSIDGTDKWLETLEEKYPNLLYVQEKIEDKGDNKWYRDCKEAAFKKASYNNIFFLDADEFLHENLADRVYQCIEHWRNNVKCTFAILYRQFIGNLFTEACGWNYIWQSRIFRRNLPVALSEDGANFYNKDCGVEIARPQIIVWHYSYVRNPQAQNKRVRVQNGRQFDIKESLEHMDKPITDYKDKYDYDYIIKESTIVKHIGGFPKVVRENPERFYKEKIDAIDEQLLKIVKKGRTKLDL